MKWRLHYSIDPSLAVGGGRRRNPGGQRERETEWLRNRGKCTWVLRKEPQRRFGSFSITYDYYEAFEVLGSFITGQDSIFFKWAAF